MARIPYCYRRAGGTYALRKRVRYPSGESSHITWSLGTKEQSQARIRAAAACAALDWAVTIVNRTIILNGGARSASETSRLVRAACDLKLGLAVADHRFGRDPDAEAANLVFGDFYALAARGDGEARLEPADEERLRGQGRTDRQISALRGMVCNTFGHHTLSDRHLELQLEALGFRYDPVTAKADRISVLTGWSRAQYRASHYHHPAVQASGDPERHLLEQGHLLTAPPADCPSAAPSVQSVWPDESRPAGDETLPSRPKVDVAEPTLGDVLDAVIDDIVARGDWSGGANGTGEDARRLIKEVRWIVGDRGVSTYNQTHISTFVREVRAMPKTVRVQALWHRPYAEAKKRFPTLVASNTRSGRTLNKDLAYLSTFAAGMVAAGYWQKGQIDPRSLSHTITKTQKRGARPPWTVAHVETMFSSPIYQGNAGAKRRLLAGTQISQDGAYWILPLAWWTAGRREEPCGIMVDDVVVEGTAIPHIVYRPNALRGLKNEASERAIPIHPRLIELGFLDYVEAIREEGHSALFPELWLFEGKKGGGQYYALCWSKLMTWLRAQPGMTVPLGTGGKPADFHSIRSTALSQLDRHDINQNIVADIAGHARQGVTAQTYQDLVASGSLDEGLREKLLVLERLPDPTRGLATPPIHRLPLALRSR